MTGAFPSTQRGVVIHELRRRVQSSYLDSRLHFTVLRHGCGDDNPLVGGRGVIFYACRGGA